VIQPEVTGNGIGWQEWNTTAALTRDTYYLVRTRDFVNWEPYTDSLRAPRGVRHGSAFRAPVSVLNGRLALDSAQSMGR